MKNNKGFGKFEIIVMILVLLVIFAFAFYMLLNGANGQRLTTMKDNAVTFSKTVSTNIASFHNTNYVYLQEAIDEELLQGIKNPFGKGNCDEKESFVHIKEGLPYVTLKCGDMFIDEDSFSNKDVKVYKVTPWSDKKGENDNDELTFYNCLENGEEVFDEYYEELYFVYMVNKKYGSSSYYASNLTACEVTSKPMYRQKTEFKQ